MPRVAGVDPGTVSFDLCVLQDGEPVVEQAFETGSLSDDSRPLLETLARHGPYDLAALGIDQGQIVDGMGGSSGPLGMRAAGALDGELAYLLGPALRKNTLYSGGALDPAGTLDTTDLEALWASPRTGNDEGGGLTGTIVVGGEVPDEAKLDRPPQPRP